MKKVYENIKQLRTQLHLSQEYVSNYLGINRSTFTQLENGKRKVTADDVLKLSVLFGVSADVLIHGAETSQSVTAFTHSFERLDESDQAEIMNLIRFKEHMKQQRSK